MPKINFMDLSSHANVFNLEPNLDHAKSFYGKAVIVDRFYSTHFDYQLYSYDTLVATYVTKTRDEFKGGTFTLQNVSLHSKTTRRHVREFAYRFGIQPETVSAMYNHMEAVQATAGDDDAEH